MSKITAISRNQNYAATSIAVAYPTTSYDDGNSIHLIHFEGANLATTTPVSHFENGGIWNIYGTGFSLSTAQKKFNNSSLVCAGTASVNGYCCGYYSSIFLPKQNDLCIEMWVRPGTAYANDQYIWWKGGSNGYVKFNYNYTTLTFSWKNGTGVVASYVTSAMTALNDGNWHHIAVCRSGENIGIAVDGVWKTLTANTAITSSTSFDDDGNYGYVYVGGASTGYNAFNGYIDEYRYSVGTSRYTIGSNFTPQVDAFAASGPADNQLLLTILDFNTATIGTMTPAYGWTLVSGYPKTGTQTTQYIYYKYASGESGSYTWSWVNQCFVGAKIFAFSDVNALSPIDVADFREVTGAAGTFPTNSITTTVNGDLLLTDYFTGIGNTGTLIWTPPSTEVQILSANLAGKASFVACECNNFENTAVAGSVSARTAVVNISGANIGIASIIAIKPLSTIVYRQKNYRYYKDDAALNSATPYANEATSYNGFDSSDPNNKVLRPRFLLENVGVETGSVTPRLEYSLNSGAWTQITNTGNVKLKSSSHFTDGDATTSILTPTPGLTFVTGQGKYSSSDCSAISLGASQYTEVEYCVELSDIDASKVQFRLTNAGVVLDIYSAYSNFYTLSWQDVGSLQTPKMDCTGKTHSTFKTSSADYPASVRIYNVTDSAVATNSKVTTTATSLTEVKGSGTFSLLSTKQYKLQKGVAHGGTVSQVDTTKAYTP